MNGSQNSKPNSSRIIKKRLSQDQVRLLEASFDAGRKLEPERKFQLARELGVPPRQIAVWYQNKRARWRSQSLELDHSTLQARLESVLADKERLEREVEGLRVELRRAHETMFGLGQLAESKAAQQAQAQLLARGDPGQLSSCGDSSSLNNDDVGLPFEELYACLMVGNGDEGTNNEYDEVNCEWDFWV
ncbi:Homeobox-leucine zipper protein ATHB-52 [Striga hermonthica]|uniref:Homeobox-leucine zipper protein n=1 Tax=Striga hermonthica TaxID=68872 RepID=A0A9N7MTW0_STRHE|nr:Homeobox-leucine zipper protein ATHB-52 [Striga hermonthica]